jgi:hypothetical protein
MQQLNVLVVESDNGAANGAIRELVESGHRAFRCHPEHSASFPCNAFRADETCPVRDANIDVAVAVRNHGHETPTEREAGVVCSIDRDIPIVVVGGIAPKSLSHFSALIIPSGSSVVEACEHSARRDAPTIDPVATEVVSAIVETECGPTAAHEVEVLRNGPEVIVEVLCEVPLRLRRLVANRIIGNLRQTEREISEINIAFS